MRPLHYLIASLLLALAPVAAAADLVIGRASEHSSIDPLFSRTGTNYSTSGAMFERLVMNDANIQLQPALAVSWRSLDAGHCSGTENPLQATMSADMNCTAASSIILRPRDQRDRFSGAH